MFCEGVENDVDYASIGNSIDPFQILRAKASKQASEAGRRAIGINHRHTGILSHPSTRLMLIAQTERSIVDLII